LHGITERSTGASASIDAAGCHVADHAHHAISAGVLLLNRHDGIVGGDQGLVVLLLKRSAALRVQGRHGVRQPEAKARSLLNERPALADDVALKEAREGALLRADSPLCRGLPALRQVSLHGITERSTGASASIDAAGCHVADHAHHAISAGILLLYRRVGVEVLHHFVASELHGIERALLAVNATALVVQVQRRLQTERRGARETCRDHAGHGNHFHCGRHS